MLLIKGEYLKLIGSAEHLFSISSAFSSLLGIIYTYIYLAAAYRKIFRDDEALASLKKALDIAMPDKQYMLFAENCDYIKPLLERIAAEGSYREDIKRIFKLYETFKTSKERMIREYFAGEKPRLTQRETEIARLAAAGMTNTEIGKKLFTDGKYEFTLTVSEDDKADIVYDVAVTVAPPDTTPPEAGGEGAISVSNVTYNSLVLSWAAATDNVTEQESLQYKVVFSENDDIGTVDGAETNGTTVKNWIANLTSTRASGLSADTTYFFNIIVRDEAGNMEVYNTTSQTTESEPSGGGSSGGGGGGGRSAPVYKAKVTGGGAPGTDLSIDVNTRSGIAVVSLGNKAEVLLGGEEIPVITVPSIEGVDTYTLEIPGTYLCSSSGGDMLTFSTDAGSVTIPGNMLTGTGLESSGDIGITIGEGDKSSLPDHVREAVGERPIVQLALTMDGEKENWSNPDAPVTVTIPYKPTKEELANPEHITVWYIDGEGNVVEVPNGRYDPVTGTVIFATTHFSRYAVVYVHKTFDDLGGVEWARQQIEVLASKGILKGIAGKEYGPQINITRADFLYYLVRTLGVDAKLEGNFDDISRDAHYYKEIGLAKKLGITSGTGNNKFNPEASITRQDMMVLTENALRMLNKLEVQGTASDLDKFADKSLIAAYAVNSVASVVKEGLIVGSGDRINPLGNTTRAEAAAFLYRIYNK